MWTAVLNGLVAERRRGVDKVPARIAHALQLVLHRHHRTVITAESRLTRGADEVRIGTHANAGDGVANAIVQTRCGRVGDVGVEQQTAIGSAPPWNAAATARSTRGRAVQVAVDEVANAEILVAEDAVERVRTGAVPAIPLSAVETGQRLSRRQFLVAIKASVARRTVARSVGRIATAHERTEVRVPSRVDAVAGVHKVGAEGSIPEWRAETVAGRWIVRAAVLTDAILAELTRVAAVLETDAARASGRTRRAAILTRERPYIAVFAGPVRVASASSVRGVESRSVLTEIDERFAELASARRRRGQRAVAGELRAVIHKGAAVLARQHPIGTETSCPKVRAVANARRLVDRSAVQTEIGASVTERAGPLRRTSALINSARVGRHTAIVARERPCLTEGIRPETLASTRAIHLTHGAAIRAEIRETLTELPGVLDRTQARGHRGVVRSNHRAAVLARESPGRAVGSGPVGRALTGAVGRPVVAIVLAEGEGLIREFAVVANPGSVLGRRAVASSRGRVVHSTMLTRVSVVLACGAIVGVEANASRRR